MFQTQLGSADFQATALGTWTEHLGFGWGAGFSSQGTAPFMGYPGYDQGFIFQQIPDFDLTLWLLHRYYFQLGYHGAFTNNTFLLGYLGQENELFRWAKLGSTAISVPSRAELPVPAGQQGNPALAFELGTPSSVHDFLARYEDNNTITKVFYGSREANTAVLDPSEWIHGRFFSLPSTALPTNISVMIQDPAGSTVIPSVPAQDPGWRSSLTGLHVRAATSAEVFVDGTHGLIQLASPSTKILLVTWSGAGSSFLDPISQQTYQGLSLPGLSGYWYVLYLPGTYSPFENKNTYPLPAGTQANAFFSVTNKDSVTALTGYSFSWIPGQDYFTLTSTSGSFTNFPFLNATSSPGDLYKPNPSMTPQGAALNLEIQVTSYATQTVSNSINLGTGILPGSVVVTRNGQSVPGAVYDPNTGTLNLGLPLYDSDQIVVTYQTANQYSTPTDLRLYQGNHWDLTPNQSLEASESLQWNLQQNRFTTQDSQAPGTIASALEWKGHSGDWGWLVNTTGAAVLADSTGYRELAGLNSQGTTANLSSQTLRPAEAPQTLTSTYTPSIPTFTATDLNRGALLYRDYWSLDPLSGAMVLGNGGSPGNENPNAPLVPYGSNGWTGPYLMLGYETRTDRVLSLESQLGANQWAGAQVVFDRGVPRDLSGTEAIRLDICLPDTLPAGTRVFFQAGSVGEDIDGTGSVAQTTGGTRPGMTFYDQTRGETVDYPLPEGSTWTNDGNGDGVLSRDGALLTRELTPLLSGSDGVQGGGDPSGALSLTSTSWQELTLRLTDTERALLRSAGGWRLVIVNPGSAWSTSARVLAESAEFEGSVFAPQTTSGTSGTTVREIPETSELQQAPQPLESLFPEISNRFNASALNIQVMELLSASDYSLIATISPFRSQVWGQLVFYYRYASGNPGTVTFTAADPSGRGLSVSWNPVAGPTTNWHKAVIDLKALTLQVDGVTQGTVHLDSSASDWDHLTLSSSGSQGVTAYFAEIHAEDPLWELKGTVRASGSWHQPHAWKVQEVSLVSGTQVTATTTTSGSTAAEPTWSGESDVVTTVLGSRWNVQTTMAATPGASQLHGAYDASLPLGPLVLSEKFSDYGSRLEEAQLNLPDWGNLAITASALGPPVRLEQNYQTSWSRWFAPLLPLTDGLTAQLNWHEIRNTELTLAPFAQQWVDSWDWLRWRTDVPDFSQALASWSWVELPSLESRPWGWNLQLNLETDQTQGSPWLAGPKTSWSAGWPFLLTLWGTPWKFTPSVARSLTLTDQNTSGMTTPELLQASWAQLGSVSPGLFSLPFSEMFTDNALAGQTASLSSGALESDAELNLNRPGTFTAWDLLWPLQADVKFLNRQSRQLSSLLTYQQTQLTLSTQANNLFGREGVDPLALWYETDQWSWNLQSSVSTGSQATDQNTQIAATVLPKVYLTSRENLQLPVKFTAQWSQTSLTTLEVTPAWDIQLPAHLPFKFPDWFSAPDFPRTIEHQLSLDILVGSGTVPSPLLQKLEAVYAAILTVSRASSLTLTLKWGNQWNEYQYLVGLEATLDMKLSF